MCEMIVVECDWKDGECLEKFSGFSMITTDSDRAAYLQEEGWLVQDNKHYCPLHKEKVVKESPADKLNGVDNVHQEGAAETETTN